MEYSSPNRLIVHCDLIGKLYLYLYLHRSACQSRGFVNFWTRQRRRARIDAQDVFLRNVIIKTIKRQDVFKLI